jgi:3-oxoacyl-[acyl-carrier-protein] synthase-1
MTHVGLAVMAAGAVTSVGFNGPATYAALRAGIRNVYQTNLWDPESAAYLAGGKVALPQWWVGVGKLADLAAPAIRECLEAAAPVPPDEIPVMLCIAPADRPFRFPDLDERLVPEIENKLGLRLHRDSVVIAGDHTSVAIALRRAGELLMNPAARCVVVAAVDSLLEHELQRHYLSMRRLLTPNNSNGFCLGEAGSAVLVVRAGSVRAPGLQILGVGLARELATIESEEPLRAEGLTEAIRQAFSEGGVTADDLDYRISDLNGEHYKFKEMMLAMMRFERRPRRQLFDLWHPIEYIGDVGAAIGPILLGLALHAGTKRYGIGPTVLCTVGDDAGRRAAIVARYQSAEDGR